MWTQFPVKSFVILSRPQKTHQMPSCRTAPNRNLISIQAILLCVRTHKSQRGLAVMNLSRPLRFLSQTIAHRDYGILPLRHPQDPSRVLLTSLTPGPAMNPYYHGNRLSDFFRQIQIQHLPRVAISDIIQIRDFLHFGNRFRPDHNTQSYQTSDHGETLSFHFAFVILFPPHSAIISILWQKSINSPEGTSTRSWVIETRNCEARHPSSE